jgi:hypothetical protein
MRRMKSRMGRSASARGEHSGYCLAPPSNRHTKAKTRNGSSGVCQSGHGSKIPIQAGPLVRNSQRPQDREAAPCQDTLRAFLAKRRMGGMFFHVQLAKHLSRAGFEVRHVERENNHADVWILKLRRGQVSAGQEIAWTKKTVLVFLKRHGLRYPRREVVVMVQGDRIKAAFNWERGEPGWLSFQRAMAGTRSGNQSDPSP